MATNEHPLTSHPLGAIGYSIYYNVFVNKLTTYLPTYTAEYAIKAGLPLADAELFVGTLLTDPTKIVDVPGFSLPILAAAQVGVRWAYADALHYVWYASIPFGIVAIICCLFLGSTAKYQTNRVAVAL